MVNRVIVFIVAAGLLISSGGRAAAQGSGEVFTDEASGVRYTVEAFIPANFPVGLAFAPDGRLFYNEKTTGSVRVVLPDGTRPTEPVITLPTDSLQERGMLGIAVDPDFERNNLLWLVHTAAGTAANWPSNRLLRFPVGENNTAGEPETLIDLPITNGELLHNGGNVHFDADGRLFISFGDYGDASNAQNLDTMQGALHRFDVTEDGLVAAEGNPFEPSSIYAYGFRNPWDFDFDPVTGFPWVTENGPSCDDEINLVLPGFNYGWDVDYPCYGLDLIPGMADYMPPLLSFTPTVGISGIIFYDHDAIPEWENDLFFCNWTFGELYRAELDETRSQVDAVHLVDLGDASCKIDITVGPEGGLYFGSVGEGNGYIYRLLPADS